MKIGAPTADEYAFVYDAWANSFKKSPWAGCVPNSLWDTVSRQLIRSTLERGAIVQVATVDIEGQDGRRVAGYTVTEPERNILHWLFVKADFRRLGVGKRLLAVACPDGDWTYTCRTRASSKFLGPRFRWDPVAARLA